MSTLSQTFFVDPNSVNNASSVYLTDVVLYFKSVPTSTQNASGVTNPSVVVSISPTKSSGASGSTNIPDYQNTISNSKVTLPYASITADANTAAVSTKFTFATPVYVETGKYYSIDVVTQDPGYQLHVAKTGDAVVGTIVSTPSTNSLGTFTTTTYTQFPGFSGGYQGNLFDYGNNGTITPRQGTQLKFSVNVAKFLANTATVQLVNRNYEFFTIANQTSAFTGGELAYAVVANGTGTVTFSSNGSTITGSGTSFLTSLQTNTTIALYVNSSLTVVRTVNAIANNISFTIKEPIPYSNATGANYFIPPAGKVFTSSQAANLLYLVDSNANSTLYFQQTQKIIGSVSNATANVIAINTLSPSSITPRFGIGLPSGSNDTISFVMSAANGSNYYTYGSPTYANAQNFKETYVTDYKPYLMSRSLEVLGTNSPYLVQGKSAVFKVTLSAPDNGAGVYASPYFSREQLDLFAYTSNINNNDALENTNSGQAYAKHITKKLTFDQGLYAEDLIVYATVFQPAGTKVEAYAKVYNANDPDSFDSKEWTPMALNNGNSTIVSTTSSNNYIELTWGIPNTPPSLYQGDGTVTVTTGNSTIVGSGTSFDQQFSNGNVVKIYQPLFQNNFQVAVITSIANATQITVNSSTTNTSILGSGMYIDKIADPYVGFLNPQNNNIVRYYNKNVVQYDAYDTVQVKFVLLSASDTVVPRIHNIRVVGVSA
jgi:hypothetical protein